MKNETVQNALFVCDWNGTLVDDARLWWRVTNASLRRLGKAEVSFAQYRETSCVPLVLQYERWGCSKEELTREVMDFCADAYEALSPELQTRKGAEALLDGLGGLGCQRVLLSNYTTDGIAPQLKRFGLAGKIDRLLANEDAGTPFNGGKIGRLQAALGERKPEVGFLFGDTLEEIEIARALGFVSIAVSGGVCSSARLQAADPDYLVATLEDVPSIVDAEIARRRAA